MPGASAAVGVAGRPAAAVGALGARPWRAVSSWTAAAADSRIEAFAVDAPGPPPPPAFPLAFAIGGAERGGCFLPGADSVSVIRFPRVGPERTTWRPAVGPSETGAGFASPRSGFGPRDVGAAASDSGGAPARPSGRWAKRSSGFGSAGSRTTRAVSSGSETVAAHGA